MRVGMVGAGLQGRRWGPALRDFPGTELVVVSAARRESAAALATQLGCEAAEGWEPVVAREDLEAVLVCTPPNLHAVITIEALKAGKHVLCEKPLARTLAEGEAMVAAARQSGRALKCGFNHRYHPAVQKVREWVQRGDIGTPLFVRCRYGIGGRPGYEKEWRADPAIVGGGQLMEQGIHGVDLARWFLGEFSQVAAFVETGFWNISPLEDNGYALLRTAAGAVASIHSSLTQWTNLFSFEVGGTKGQVSVEGLGASYATETAVLSRRDFDGPFSHESVEFRGGDISWREQWREFVTAIAEGREPEANGEDGLEALRIVFAAYEAARSGATVTLR